MIIETKRLALRKWTSADFDELFEILRDPLVIKNIGDGQPFTAIKVKDFLAWSETSERENGFCRWKIIEKSSGQIAGTCGFGRISETNEIELGYLLRRQSWGKGYATEIAGAAAEYGFDNLSFREIIALTDLDNAASHNVLEKIGFHKRGIETYQGKESLVFFLRKTDD